MKESEHNFKNLENWCCSGTHRFVKIWKQNGEVFEFNP